MARLEDTLSLVKKTKSENGLPPVLASYQFPGSNLLGKARGLMIAKGFSNDDQIIKMKLNLDHNSSSSSSQAIYTRNQHHY